MISNLVRAMLQTEHILLPLIAVVPSYRKAVACSTFGVEPGNNSRLISYCEQGYCRRRHAACRQVTVAGSKTLKQRFLH